MKIRVCLFFISLLLLSTNCTIIDVKSEEELSKFKYLEILIIKYLFDIVQVNKIYPSEYSLVVFIGNEGGIFKAVWNMFSSADEEEQEHLNNVNDFLLILYRLCLTSVAMRIKIFQLYK